MTVSTTVAVQSAHFDPVSALARDSRLRLELERTVPFCRQPRPTLWIRGGDGDSTPETVETSDDTNQFDIIERRDGDLLVRTDWKREQDTFVQTLAATDATCIRAVNNGGNWRLTLRFPSRDSLADCYRRCHDSGIRLGIRDVTPASGAVQDPCGPNVTAPQREALLTAMSEEYFSVPRQTTLRGLAATLGISDTAASQRLRRGLQTVLSDTLRDDSSC